MRKNDLQPTDDNIRNTVIRDSIGRNKDLLNFIKIIDSIDESFSIALDSYWGSGKTFFVKQVKMILDANNEFTYDSVEEKDKVIEKWNKLLGEDKINTDYHIPIYYDAWANDNDNDPILSIVYQIIQTVGNHADIKEQKGLSSVFNLAGDIFALVKGFNPLELAKKLKSENPLEAIIQTKSLKERIDEFIESLIPEHGERLLIIIDELDRCNPEFAVKLLERIKHYFNNDKLTFVFSVNLAELQHTIKHHYGADFNASRYLDRFFDLRIQLPQPDMERYLKFHKIYDNYTFDDSLKLVIIKYNLQLREISKYIQLARTAVSDLAYNPNLRINNAMTFVIQVIIPITIALMVTDNKKYNEFINGNDISVLREFYSEKETIENTSYFLSFLYNENQNTYYSADEIMSDMDLFYNKLDTFYNCFFKQFQNAKVGMCSITKIERNNFKKLISLLSDTAMKNLENKED